MKNHDASAAIHRATKAKLPSIDGWRALSIGLVLAAHSTSFPGYPAANRLETCLPFFFDGNLGVRFFFVISGFLITYLLIQEHDQNGNLSLKGFYLRRAFRILPVYFAYLLVIALLQFFTPAHQAAITWVGDLSFTTNFLPRGILSGHLWSLAVEEQFYLLWPLLFVWLIRRERFWRRILIIPMVIALLCHMVVWLDKVPWILHPLFHYQSSLVNFDSLATGCLAAFGLARHRTAIQQWIIARGHFSVAALGAVLILWPFIDTAALAPLATIAGHLSQAFGFALLLLTSILFPASFRPLNWPWVIHVGIVSYSIYIWQQIFYAGAETYGAGNHWWLAFPGWLVPTLLVAWVSYYGLEKPLLKLRAHFRRA